MKQSIKLGFKYAVHTWGYHLVAMLIGTAFISSMSGVWGMIINSLLIVGVVAVALNEGAYQGEKACTAAATIEKQLKEGRRVSELQKKMVYKRSVAAWIMIFGCLPFLLLSGVNLIAAQQMPAAVVEESGESTQGDDAFAFDYDGQQERQESSVNPVNAAARVVFSAYVAFYALMSSSALNGMFFVFSLPIAAAMAIGYLCGPRMRDRKLRDIAKGKKRKMRNLKVNQNRRQSKAEV